MATDKATITVRETKSLADRLAGRGLSKLSRDTPEQQSDLLLAAGAMRAMARHLNDADILAVGNVVRLEHHASERDVSPEVVAETATRVAIEINKATLAQHRRFLEMLLAVAPREQP